MTTTTKGWLDRVLLRLPLLQPGTLVASEEGVGVFLGNWGRDNRAYA